MKLIFTLILFVLTINLYSQSSDTLYPVKVYTADGYKYGYINREGNISIMPQYAFAKDFSEGLAFVKNNNSSNTWVCINTNNKIEFEFESKYAFDYVNGLAKLINLYDSTYYIDKNGNTSEYHNHLSFDAKYIPVPFYENNKWGYKLGVIAFIAAVYELAGEYSEGLAPVFFKLNESDLPAENCYNVFIDLKGEVIIIAEMTYDDKGHLKSGYFYSPGKWVNGVCRYYSSNDIKSREVKYLRSDGKVIW